MEIICNMLKDFIINSLSIYLERFATEAVPLPDFTDSTVIPGSIDIERNTAPNMCFIVPDIQQLSELSISSQEEHTEIDIWFFVRKDTPENLFLRSLRFAAAFKTAVLNDWSIGGAFTQAYIKEIEYFDNVENSDGKIRAVRCGMTILTELMEA